MSSRNITKSSSSVSSTSSSKLSSKPSSSSSSWLRPPAPIRRLFALFPLQTLHPNPLPSSRNTSSPISGSTQPTLYIFTTPADARRNAPSFNPSCLKWQAWLRVQGVEVRTVASNNHASPSGALPFLIPAAEAGPDANGKPIPAGKLYNWAQEHGRGREKLSEHDGDEMREEAYMSLIEHRIRAAWLHTLYLTPNFYKIVFPLYIAPSSTSLPVQLTLASSLRAAACASLANLAPRISFLPSAYVPSILSTRSDEDAEVEATRLYKGAADAFAALSTLLGEKEWFSGAKEPGILDVSLFAYTHLLLDEELGGGWVDTRVKWELVEFKNLVQHRKRLYKRCFG